MQNHSDMPEAKKAASSMAQAMPKAEVKSDGTVAFSPAPANDHKVPSLTLSLTKDKMQALLTVKPGPDPTEKLLLEDIVVAGERMGLDSGRFNPEVLQNLCEAWNQKREILSDVVVAESFQPPQSGTPGKLQWLIQAPWSKGDPATASKNSQVDPAMRDLREVKSIVAVEAGQPVLRIVPPGKGNAGENLLGQAIPAQDGAPFPFQPGINIDEVAGSPGIWKANKSGFLRLKDGRPEVQECFTVEGDVDYSTGNIKYERSAEIRGDIQDGFGVAVGGDLAIGGTVGDCRLVVGSNVLIRGGFQGKGQGQIVSKGAVTLGFGGNQSVRAYGAIEIMKEAYNMQLFSRDTLRVHGNLVGGRSLAQQSIECSVAGNDHGTPTLIEIGFDYVALEGLQEVDTRLKEFSEAQSRFQVRMNQLKEMYRLKQKMEPDLAREMMGIRQALDKLAQALPILNSRRLQLADTLRKGLQRNGLQVRIEKQAYAGVTIKMGTEQMRLSENLSGPRRFVFAEGRIKVY